VALGVECWRARSAIWTANEGDARVYFVVSGRSDRILHISRRRALKRSSGGAVVDECSDIDNSRYRRRHNCTETRSRKSLRKLLSRGTSNRNVAGNCIDDEGDRRSTNAFENAVNGWVEFSSI